MTRSQIMARDAYARVAGNAPLPREYVSFAKKFPALVHTCGLVQAVAFAEAKGECRYLSDLTAVLTAAGHPEITEQQTLDHHARNQTLGGYLRLSRDALQAASWLKRYVEAAGEEA